nr:zinc finger protein 784 [Caretta caretta]
MWVLEHLAGVGGRPRDPSHHEGQRRLVGEPLEIRGVRVKKEEEEKGAGCLLGMGKPHVSEPLGQEGAGGLSAHCRTRPGPHPLPAQPSLLAAPPRSRPGTGQGASPPAKPYACSFCPERFKRASDRRDHGRVPTGERPTAAGCAAAGKLTTGGVAEEEEGGRARCFLLEKLDRAPQLCPSPDAHELGVPVHAPPWPLSPAAPGQGKPVHAPPWRPSPRAHSPHGRLPAPPPDARQYICFVCSKRFKRATDLKEHLWVPTGERPFACRVFGKRFTRSSALATHLRIHTGERPHRSPVCPKSFNNASNFAKHRRGHSGERPHRCALCGKSFREHRWVVRHLRAMHPPLG